MGWPYQQKPPMGWPLDYDSGLVPEVGFWPMLAGSGNKVFDLSGNGNTGTLQGDTSWQPGKFGSSLYFDGSGNDFVAFGDPPQLTLNRDFTLYAIVNTSDITDWQVIWSHGDSDWLFRQNNAGKLEFLESQVALVLAADTALTVGKTHHVAVTVGSGATATVTIYLDGVQDGQTTTNRTFNDGTRQATIGIADDSTGDFHPWTGLIEAASIFRALSASEIALLSRYPFWMFKDPAEIALLGGYQVVAGTILPQITSAYMRI